MLGKSIPVKYGDRRNLILIVHINVVDTPNVLVDLGEVINAITFATVITLGLRNLKRTPINLELVGCSNIGLVGKWEYITISADSWKYPVDLLVLHTQSPTGGHPLILGIPSLTTAYAYIRC